MHHRSIGDPRHRNTSRDAALHREHRVRTGAAVMMNIAVAELPEEGRTVLGYPIVAMRKHATSLGRHVAASNVWTTTVAEQSTLGTPSSLSRRAVLTRRSVCRHADGSIPRVAAHHHIPNTLRRFKALAHRATASPERLTSPVALARPEGLLAGVTTSMRCVTQRCHDGGIVNCWPSARGSP